MQSLDLLPQKGVYTLVILLQGETSLRINGRKCSILQRGYYAYTGSALGKGATSIRKRVERHLKKRKNKHWHIDYLLADSKAKVEAVIAAQTSINQECRANRLIQAIKGTTIPIAGFGASDCKHGCRSHLVYNGENSMQNQIVEAYTSLFKCDMIRNLTLDTVPSKQEVERDCG